MPAHTMKAIAGAAALTAALAVPSLAGETTGSYEFVGRETVLCLANRADEDLVVVLGEQFIKDKRFRSRVLQMSPGNTSCLRYDDLDRVLVEFTTKARVDEGDQIMAQQMLNRPICLRVKGGAARFYNLDVAENGRRSCDKDTRSDADIRALVAGSKPLTIGEGRQGL